MSMSTDASTARSTVGAREAFERMRAGTLAIDIAIVSGVSLLLGLIRLGSPALWFDEAYTYRQINKGYLDQFDGYQPFYYWIQKPWTDLVGTSEWALRFPSVVGAMLAGSLLVVLGRRLFDRRVALLSGLFLATSPYFVKWSQQARVYPFLAAASIVAMLFLLRALERGTRGAWALYGVAFTGLVVTHAVVGLLLVPAQAVLIAQRRERVLPHGLLAGVVVVGLGVPWVAQLAMRTNGDATETSWIPYPSAAYVSGALMGVAGAAGFGLLLSVIGLWALRRSGEGGVAVWLGSWAFGPILLALVISLVRPIFLDRYLVVAAPAFAVLAAVAIMSLARRARVVALAAAVVATCVGLVLWYQTTYHGNWRGEDWRSAVAFAQGRADGDVVVVPWWAHDAAEYYGARARDVSSADSVWVLSWSEDGHDLPVSVRAPLGFGQHRLVESHPFGWRVTAQLWQRPDSP
jgi:mannosyltransferase